MKHKSKTRTSFAYFSIAIGLNTSTSFNCIFLLAINLSILYDGHPSFILFANKSLYFFPFSLISFMPTLQAIITRSDMFVSPVKSLFEHGQKFSR